MRNLTLEDIAAVFKMNQEAMHRAEDLLEENESLDAFVWIRGLADKLIYLAEDSQRATILEDRIAMIKAFGYSQ